MELQELLAVLRRRLWILLTVPLVAAATAAVVSFFVLIPVYEAKTSLWVVKTDGAALDYNTLLFNRNLTRTYGEVAKSRTVALQVIERLELPETVEDFQKRITVTPLRDTEIITISVQDANPMMAARIANTLAHAFSGEIQQFIRLDNVRVVDEATAPIKPVRPRRVLNTALALVAGFMVGVGMAFLLEQLDVRIRTPDDVQRHIELPVLGVIPVLQPASSEEEAATRGRAGKTTPKVMLGGGDR